MSDSANQQFPKFLSSSPTGDDIFEGKSQDKISNTIFNLIKDKSLPNNVIGLEGKWGSGKSNVIENIRSKFDTCDLNYDFFTYDAWGHQEDLTRKTFLEELIFQLKDGKKFKGKTDWEQELKKLLSKTSTKNTYRFPKIKFYWILITASILLFSFLGVLLEDFFPKVDENRMTFFLSKYLAPLSLFIYGIYEMIMEYREFDKNEETKKIKWKERLKRLFYVFSGSDIESTELENVLEEEPSVRQFKVYFEKILNDLKSEGLIIVFDNMDRLSDSTKVLSLWSSIYTFFSEEKKSNVWVIIPYDKEHLSSHFGQEKDENENRTENFIGKTFSTIFRISPPVLSDWKKFFNIKFKEAFGNLFKDDEIDFISSLYEIILDSKNRRPRDIITFVNHLVSLYMQHNSAIELKYLALFLLRKKEILDNSLIAISSKDFMKGEKYLFTDDKEIEESMASIVYNVDKEKANEVLLRNSIEDLFRNPNKEVIDGIKANSDFKTYLDNFIRKCEFSSFYPENTVQIFHEVKDIVSSSTMNGYWEKFVNNLDRRDEKEFTVLNNWHKETLLNVTKSSANKFANKISYSSRDVFKDNHRKYYYIIHDLLEFIKSNSLGIKPSLSEIEFSPENFVDFIDDFSHLSDSISLKEMNIVTENEKLNDYFINAESGILLETHKWLHCIDYLKDNETKKYNFEKLENAIEGYKSKIGYNKKEDIKMYLEIVKSLKGKNKYEYFNNSFLDQYLNTNGNKTDEPYYDIISNYISILDKVNPNSNSYLLDELNKTENSEEIAKVIQYHMTYGDLLAIIVDYKRNHPLLKELALKLTENSYSFTQILSPEWVFLSIDKLKSKIFNENIDIFLKSFDQSSKHFSKKITKNNALEFGKPIVDLTCELGNKDYKSLEHYHKVSNEMLKDINEEDWVNDFETPTIKFYCLDSYVINDLLDKSVTKSAPFMGAYEAFLKKIAKREIAIPQNQSFWDKLIEDEYLDNGRLNRIFNDILDLLLGHSEIKIEEIKFFSNGIFNQASNIKETHKADEIIRKLILPIKDINDLTATFTHEIINIINSSSDAYSQELFELLSNESKEKESPHIDLIIQKTKLKGFKINSKNDESTPEEV
ncbi:P-loop NTPase fold protein [uncultured Winogradskyella sp.]|uniref:P-loop NTPase fold protein n=1 Tax=uncultured Winogradskyella sp. TaxID=395353 RepID=UPI002633410A|nr:P-loop NTPase fold protein [uncultured Winogradskyella sp.]